MDDVVVVVVLGFTTLLTSQVTSVAFYSEREKSDKFLLRGSKALLRAVNLRHGTHGFTSLPKEFILRIFYTLKKSIYPGRILTSEPRIEWRV